jgi:hypothetical protein
MVEEAMPETPGQAGAVAPHKQLAGTTGSGKAGSEAVAFAARLQDHQYGKRGQAGDASCPACVKGCRCWVVQTKGKRRNSGVFQIEYLREGQHADTQLRAHHSSDGLLFEVRVTAVTRWTTCQRPAGWRTSGAPRFATPARRRAATAPWSSRP